MAHVRQTIKRISLPGGRTLNARCWDGEGDPIVLLHGLLSSSTAWIEICASLGRPCVAFDLPGFGGSHPPTRAHVGAYADDVAAGIAALGIARFDLVGHSFGGAVAAAVAEQLPAATRSLLLLAPAGFGRNQLAEAVTRRAVCPLAKALIPRLMTTRRQRAQSCGALGAAAGQAAIAIAVAGRCARGFHRRVVDYPGPVTALWGTADRVVPAAHASGVSVAFPHADVILWDGAGHNPQRDHADAVAQLVGGTRPRQPRPLASPRSSRCHSGALVPLAQAA